MSNRRNPGIDVFRCILIYAICAYHAFFCCGHANGCESRLWTWAVPGFAFISGYYGVRFSWRKILKLWLAAILCAVVPYGLGRLGCGRSMGYIELLYGNWYLIAYTLLILLSPFIN